MSFWVKRRIPLTTNEILRLYEKLVQSEIVVFTTSFALNFSIAWKYLR